MSTARRTPDATTSALVAVLSGDDTLAARARASIAAREEFLVGEPEGRRLPLVLEGRSPERSRQAFEWLARLDGVENLELVFVDFVGRARDGVEG